MQLALMLVALAVVVAPAFATFLVARNGDSYGWNNNYNGWGYDGNKGYNGGYNGMSNGWGYDGNKGYNRGYNSGYNGGNNDWNYDGNKGYRSSPYYRSYVAAPYGARSLGYGAYDGSNSWNNYDGYKGNYMRSYSYPTNYYSSYSSPSFSGFGHNNFYNGGYGSHGSRALLSRSFVMPSYGGLSGYNYLYKRK